MANNVAEQVLDILVEAGIRQIFGVPGDAINHFVDAVRRRKEIEWIAVRDEATGAFAACAQADLTGSLAACVASSGPGALQMVNGLYNAKRGRVPVIALTGQVPRGEIGLGYHEEADLTAIFDGICAFQAIIRSPEEAPRLVQHALRVAWEQQTVCRIELPADVAELDAEGESFRPALVPGRGLPVPAADQVEAAVALINEKSRVTIFAGEGCRHARPEVLELAARLRAPIVHTLKASDIFDLNTEGVVGMTGLLGSPSGYHAIMRADLLLMLGTDFPYSPFLPENTPTIQVDIRLENIGKRTPVTVGLHGDLGLTVRRLLDGGLTAKEDGKFLATLQDSHRQWLGKMEENSDLSRDRTPLHPQLFASQINKLAAPDAVFAADVGECLVWAARYMTFDGGRRLTGSFNYGAMGVALPAALGAQACYPGRQVWALIGDGAFGMVMADFLTAVRYGWPIKVIVFNNGEHGIVKVEMEESGLPPFPEALELHNPDFAAFARLCGGDGARVETADGIVPAIRQAIDSDKPFLIDAVVSPGELILPPTVTLAQAWGFGRSKAKEVLLSIRGEEKQWKNLMEELKAKLG